MKYLLVISGLLSGIIFSYGQSTSLSRIVIYRENNIRGSNIAHNIYMNDSLIINITNNSFYSYDYAPGNHTFTVGKFQYTAVALNTEAGKSYYLKFSFKWENGTPLPVLTPVDESTAGIEMNKGSIKKRDKQYSPIITSKNRIGININLGGGFSNVTLATSTTGINSTISFGGGYAIGLKYGHEYNEHFDLALGASYQYSELTPALANADATFNRGILSATPAYILPIGNGTRMRMKFGAGVDYYFGTSFKINMSKLSRGFNDHWKYKNTTGYHISVTYEILFSEHWSVSAGLKGYYAAYTFQQGHYAPSPKLKSPDASGIDLTGGIYYHF